MVKRTGERNVENQALAFKVPTQIIRSHFAEESDKANEKAMSDSKEKYSPALCSWGELEYL